MPDTLNTITVHIPAALRPQVGDQESIPAAGDTVGDVLQSLGSQYPDFAKRLYAAHNNGEEAPINRFINVYLNDEDIRFLDNLGTPVSAGDELSIVPAIAGG